MDEIKFLKRDLDRIKNENKELLAEVAKLKENGAHQGLDEKNEQIKQLALNLRIKAAECDKLKSELADREKELRIKVKEVQSYKDECKKWQAAYKQSVPEDSLVEYELKIKELTKDNEKKETELLSTREELFILDKANTDNKDRVDLLITELNAFKGRYDALLDVRSLKGKTAVEKLKKLAIEKEKEVYESKQIEAALRVKLRETLENMKSTVGTEVVVDKDVDGLKKRLIEYDSKLKELTFKYTHKDSECMSLRKKLMEAGSFCMKVAEAQPTIKGIGNGYGTRKEQDIKESKA